jgi:hypothetical protein
MKYFMNWVDANAMKLTPWLLIALGTVITIIGESDDTSKAGATMIIAGTVLVLWRSI